MEFETHSSLVDRLKIELQNLPGEDAHRDMLPFRLTASEALKKPVDYRLSAVLLLLYFQNNVPHFILTERQAYGGNHSGQISLPGGKVEQYDRDTGETALRETQEEIGVSPSEIELIGRLTEVYIPVSNFLIHPYIGFISQIPRIAADEREVKTVLHCSVSELRDQQNRIETKFQTSTGVWMKNIPAFQLQEKIVWGATAIILNEFKFILNRFE